MRRLSIWNKFIQSLLCCDDRSSVKLAFILGDKSAIANWWYLSDDMCTQYGLPWIKDNFNLIMEEIKLYPRVYNQALSGPTMLNEQYIKALYEKNNTVE